MDSGVTSEVGQSAFEHTLSPQVLIDGAQDFSDLLEKISSVPKVKVGENLVSGVEIAARLKRCQALFVPEPGQAPRHDVRLSMEDPKYRQSVWKAAGVPSFIGERAWILTENTLVPPPRPHKDTTFPDMDPVKGQTLVDRGGTLIDIDASSSFQ